MDALRVPNATIKVIEQYLRDQLGDDIPFEICGTDLAGPDFIRIDPEKAYAIALMYFTGSDNFNQVLC